MKSLSKLIAVAFVLAALFFSTNVKAQTTPPPPPPPAGEFVPTSFSVGPEVGIPVGRASNVSNIEAGGTAQFQFNTSRAFAITLTSGYYDMIGKENPTGGNYNGYQIVPVKLGLKEFIAPQLYIDEEAGAGIVTTVDGHTKLDLSGGIGYQNRMWDLSARYESFSGQAFAYGLAGLRLAYRF